MEGEACKRVAAREQAIGLATPGAVAGLLAAEEGHAAGDGVARAAEPGAGRGAGCACPRGYAY